MAPANSCALDALGDENWWLRIRVPAELDPFLVYKGSIAIDGISLTIAALEADVLSVTIIPHTYRNTTLGGYRPGARVNLECDILAKHVEKLLRKLELKSPLTVEKLARMGSEWSSNRLPPAFSQRAIQLRPRLTLPS